MMRSCTSALGSGRALRRAVLCYVFEPWTSTQVNRVAYFTTQPLAEAWGDDWNDSPYDCNAGRPYTWRRTRYAKQPDATYKTEPNPQPPWREFEAEFTGPFDTPAVLAFNTPYCVQDINDGKIPWLWTDSDGRGPSVVVNAGVSFTRFRTLVRRAGGTVGRPQEMAVDD
jgi:hypothetical protein